MLERISLLPTRMTPPSEAERLPTTPTRPLTDASSASQDEFVAVNVGRMPASKLERYLPHRHANKTDTTASQDDRFQPVRNGAKHTRSSKCFFLKAFTCSIKLT